MQKIRPSDLFRCLNKIVISITYRDLKVSYRWLNVEFPS